MSQSSSHVACFKRYPEIMLGILVEALKAFICWYSTFE
jgi:hypothetical protein